MEAKFVTNNTALFDSAYQQFSRAIYANIRKIVKDQDAVEDILQEVFLALWEKLDEGYPFQSIASWLFVVSHNKSVAYLKKQVQASLIYIEDLELPGQMQVSPYDTGEEELLQKQLSVIEEAVLHLPGRKREVFRLNKFEGKDVAEIAVQLGISQSSVREYLKQSIRLIRLYISTRHKEAIGISLLLLLLR